MSEQYNSETLLEEMRRDGCVIVSAKEDAIVAGAEYVKILRESVGANADSAKWGVIIQDDGTVEQAVLKKDMLELFGYHGELFAVVDGVVHVFELPPGPESVESIIQKSGGGAA